MVGLRIADQRVQPQRVGEFVAAVQRDVREVGAQLVVAGLGADIDVVEYAVHDGVRLIDHCIARVTLFMAAAPLVLKTGASRKISLRSRVESRKQRVEADDSGVGDLPLQRAGEAEPFLLMLVDVVAREDAGGTRHSSGSRRIGEPQQVRRAGAVV